MKQPFARTFTRAGFFCVALVSLFIASSALAVTSLSDTFTDVAGTLLSAHTSDSGNTWAVAAGAGSIAVTDANRIRGNGAGVVYSSNWTPDSADYDVAANLYVASASYDQIGIGGRCGAAGFTGYFVLLETGPVLKLYRAGNATPLATYSVTLSAGQTHTLRLRMRSTNVKVLWDGATVINVTPTGGDVVSVAGKACAYSQGSFTNTTGIHMDNFVAEWPALSAGTLTEVSHAVTTSTVSWTDADGGSAPIAAQLQRSPSGAGSWANVVGATTSPYTDTGLTGLTAYDYRVAFTDASSTTVYSNTLTVTTTDATTVYTVQQADLWDNGYDNVAAPRQSTFAHFIFQTNTTSITVGGTSTIYTSYPTFAHLGVRIDGVDQSSLQFTGSGAQSFTVALGGGSATKTVEIIDGAESSPAGTVLGSFVDSISYPASASFVVQSPSVQADRIVVYGDSISAGGNATNPEIEAYIPLLRNTYNKHVMEEGWGYRSLYDDANTALLRSAFVSRVAGYSPEAIWIAIGTNDYGLNKWSAANFGTAYAALLDDLHTSLPSARIFCQTPIVRSTETANGLGNTLADYRTQISTACNARSWTKLIDGSAFLTTGDLQDGVHPTTAGHAKYAKRIAPAITSPSYTVTGPSSGNTTTSTAFTVTLGSAVFMGDQTITISAPSGTVTSTATGGSITGNGTATVAVTPAADQTSFTFLYTPGSQGTSTLSFTNSQGWTNPSSASYLHDSVSPTVSLAASVSSPTNHASFTVTSTFSENVSGFTIGDIAVTNGTVSNFTTSTSAVYSFTVTPTTDGLVSVNIAASSSMDALGNPSGAASALSVTYDSTAPSTPVISPPADTYTSNPSIVLSSAGSDTIRYTTDGSTPTCSVGTLYSSSFVLSASASVKAIGCDTAGNSSAVTINAYVVNTAGGGGSSFIPLPTPIVVNATPSATPTTGTVQTTTSATQLSTLIIQNPSDLTSLLATLSLTRNLSAETIVTAQITADAQEFSLPLTNSQATAIRNFIVYGISPRTIKLGQGERRALMRDYFETVHRGDVVWSDVERLANGQIPVSRNLVLERAQVSTVLDLFKKLYGHNPRFQNASENLAWNTLMYRIRFNRDMTAEARAMRIYQQKLGHAPRSPLGWAGVRVLAYITGN